MSKVKFFYADRILKMKNKTLLKNFVAEIFELEKRDLNFISYVFCSDEYLLDLNRRFLSHDYFTDIITFDLSTESTLSGEVYISIDRVLDNAKAHSVSSLLEARRVIFHGALHLCGYGDKTKREIKVMREKEDHYLRLFAKKTDGWSL